MTVVIRVNDSEIRQYLTQLSGRLSNLQPVFRNIGEYMLLSITQRFDAEVDADGNAWAALTAATITRKQRKGKINKILQQDGDLRRTIIYQVTPNQLEVGTDRIYGAIHQFGGQAGRGQKVTIPARPFLGISATDELEIVSIIQAFINIS